MQTPPKRLGEMLVEAGLITPGQLQSAITHQKIVKGRLGSNLVALGFITEEVLMSFLAAQSGVPHVDVRGANPPVQLLKLIPKRMAEQFTMLPVAFKEPESLVLAMSDPLDLNALDSARFAAGMAVEPVVACHSALRQMISVLYARLETSNAPTVLEVGEGMLPEGLPVPGFDDEVRPLRASFTQTPSPTDQQGWAAGLSEFPAFPPDPFGLFDAPGTPRHPGLQAVPAPGVLQERILEVAVPRLEAYDARLLVLGLIKLMQRRGWIGEGELERLIANLMESGDLKENRRRER